MNNCSLVNQPGQFIIHEIRNPQPRNLKIRYPRVEIEIAYALFYRVKFYLHIENTVIESLNYIKMSVTHKSM